jgi:hypothetical protein
MGGHAKPEDGRLIVGGLLTMDEAAGRLATVDVYGQERPG